MENKTADSLPKMLPGAVCQQWKKCGKPNCRCHRGQLHGPYYYRFTQFGGHQQKQYIRLAEVEEVKQACEAYRNYWREVNQGLQQLRDLTATIRSLEAHVHSTSEV